MLTALFTNLKASREFKYVFKLLNIGRINNMHSIIALLLLFTSTYSWCSTWEFAPSTASAKPESTAALNFQQLEDAISLRELTAESDGWFWLKSDIEIADEDNALLVFGTKLAWFIWLENMLLASGGSGPPRWAPSLPVPTLVSLPGNMDGAGTILMKAYLREGYSEMLPSVLVGEREKLAKRQLSSILIQLGIPMFTVLLALLLFVGGIATYASGRIRPKNTLAFYGLLMGIVYSEPILMLIPNFESYMSWELISIIVTAALPYALSSWRKFGTSFGIRENLIVSVVDFIIATAISLWLILPRLGFPLVPERFHSYFDFNPVPIYALISEAAALTIWLSCSAKHYAGKTSSLLIFLAAGFPSLISLFLQLPPERIYQAFLAYGLPLSILSSLLAVIWQGRNSLSSRFRINRQYQIIEGGRRRTLLERANRIRLDSKLPANEVLARSIRTTLFPDSIPWDPKWQLISVWQGANYPVSGFHDFYLSKDKRLSGFSLMDTGVENLSSLIFSFIVRSELARCFKSIKSLPNIVSRVNRRVIDAARASEQQMAGIVGQFEDGYITLLPITWPALLLKRKNGNKIISIRASRQAIGNPAIGNTAFKANNLRTLDVSMYHGDIVLIYAPKVLELTSASGETLGLKRLALALKQSEGRSLKEATTNIISEVQTFVGTDQIPLSLQLMLIKYT